MTLKPLFRSFAVKLLPLVLVASVFSPSQALVAQPSMDPRRDFWRPDGPVNAILFTNDTVYLGGRFSYIGPETGGSGCSI